MGFVRFIASVLALFGYVLVAPSFVDALETFNTFGGPVEFFMGLTPWIVLLALVFQVVRSFPSLSRQRQREVRRGRRR